MLSNDSKIVLDAIKALTGDDGNFKIIEAEEIIEKLSREMTKVELSSVIRVLKDREYIKVKYFTPDEYCLLTTRRAEEAAAAPEESVKSVIVKKSADEQAVSGGKKEKTVKPVKRGTLFIAAFLGSMLGGGIVTAVAILLQIYLV